MNNQNIIIFGMKNCGKSTLALNISKNFKMKLIKTDYLIEKLFFQKKSKKLSFREIHKKYGADYFRQLEKEVLDGLANEKIKKSIIDCGGGTVLNKSNQSVLKKIGLLIWINLDQNINYKRIIKNGIPAFFKYQNDSQRSFDELIKERFTVYRQLTDYIIELKNENEKQVLNKFNELKII